MTPEQFATDLVANNPPRLQDGWAEGLAFRIAEAIRSAKSQAATEERERWMNALKELGFKANPGLSPKENLAEFIL